MFRYPIPENTPRSKPPTGKIASLTIPYKGLNAKAPLSVMEPGFALSLSNLFCEPGGLRSRKGYTELAKNIPASVSIPSILSYFPKDAISATVFAAKDGKIYDITTGGSGPWTEEAGVAGDSDWWTGLNFQNIAGSFLCICNQAGGYAIFNGTTWVTVAAGTDPGEIDGVDPADLVFLMEFKKRIWFIEKNSTNGWFLPVGQITGTVSQFDFGEQFRHGGKLVALVNWTIDGGEGLDDYLVAVSSEGDVVVYKGTDPTSADTFEKRGTWYVGTLPSGHRQVTQNGGDVYILSQSGLVPLSRLLEGSKFSLQADQRISEYIDPLITELMRYFQNSDGWQLIEIPHEELFLVALPQAAWAVYGNFLAYKISTRSWSSIRFFPLTTIREIGAEIFAGTADGRVVKAFEGPLDNVLIGTPSGNPIVCQATPAYEALGNKATQKRFELFKPSFIATAAPEVKLTVLTNYGLPSVSAIARFPDVEGPVWDNAVWDVGKWAGKQFPFSRWFGVNGEGFAATVQIDFACGGDTLLMAADFWLEEGGVL